MKVMTLDSVGGGFRGLRAITDESDAAMNKLNTVLERAADAVEAGGLSTTTYDTIYTQWNDVAGRLQEVESSGGSQTAILAEVDEFVSWANRLMGRPPLPKWLWWSMGAALIFGGTAAAVIYASPRKRRTRRRRRRRRRR